MDKNFTQNDLLELIYSEKEHEEALELISALCSNWNLKEQFEGLYDTYKAMPKAQLSPSNACIDAILDYANHNEAIAC